MDFLKKIFAICIVVRFAQYFKPELTQIFQLLDNGHPIRDLLWALERNMDTFMGSGFSIAQIDKTVKFIVIIRFIILSVRYNIITSFIITSTSCAAAYLWYAAFLRLMFVYENALYGNKFLYQLGLDATATRSIVLYNKAMATENNSFISFRNPIGILFTFIKKGIIYEGRYIDPFSLLTAMYVKRKFICSEQVEATYYLVYNEIIPFLVRYMIKFGRYIKGFASYTVVVRIGKKYCPYLIRWHWTCLIFFRFLEQIPMGMCWRIDEYVGQTLYPLIKPRAMYNLSYAHITFEMGFMRALKYVMIITEFSYVLFAMLHALCGQYFYIPFLTENIELHIGPRNKLDIYSGGQTTWQDPEYRDNIVKFKVWYGWFGRGTKNKISPLSIFVSIIRRLSLMIVRSIRKFLRKFNNRRKS